MQFNVPQFIEVEDKILGPLTFRQFFLAVAVVLILLFLWYYVQLWFFLIVAAPLAGLTFALIFVKINGRSFSSFLVSWINYHLNPKIYTWRRK